MTAHRLDQLLQGIADTQSAGDIVVSGLSLDSRQVRPGHAFFALRGTREHGIHFAAGAVERGAQVVLAEGPQVDAAPLRVPVLWIDNLHGRVGDIAARFFGEPSQSLAVVGVTGTNGKTSTVQLLAQSLEQLGHRAATIGTLGAGLHGQLTEGERTTPDAIHVQGLLAQFRADGATHVAMEVSSHALEQGRVGAVHFAVAAFTNLTRDHLDYHGSMQAYGAAKAKLFAWPGLHTAVINIDDAFGRELVDTLAPDVQILRVSAAGDSHADIVATSVVTSSEGLAFVLRTPWGERPLHSHLLGCFNVANLLTVVGCLGALGAPFEGIVAAVEAMQPVNGRMNRLGGFAGEPLVVVDYAHTPDALEQALTALRAHCAGRLICVFGCGGDRDGGKRPVMGAIAERLADSIVVTDDNPRSESGDAIVAQIVAGLTHPEQARIERDREAAIGWAVAQARSGDVVLVAGKGHETYQESAAGKRPFDDFAIARAALEARA
ncbi:UDP-N-acetylmuramoyl-L-alanyl-D-glutamate--2,6-diaminopimelate ligase [Dyella sp.]|uniref:UDP-N-acetylmuramoyl-L-alanyl-D-glutamate--2, 6-diaminopimelate ligase n=1 Tax=Dyella sp. TaxID=1869338 RepID=UPI002ED5BA38